MLFLVKTRSLSHHSIINTTSLSESYQTFCVLVLSFPAKQVSCFFCPLMHYTELTEVSVRKRSWRLVHAAQCICTVRRIDSALRRLKSIAWTRLCRHDPLILVQNLNAVQCVIFFKPAQLYSMPTYGTSA